MVKVLSFFVAGAGVFAAMSCGDQPRMESATAAPIEAEDPKAIRIQATNITALYNDSCARCHGQGAEGGGGGTPTLLTKDKFDQKWDKPFFEAIKRGVPDMGMEAFGETLSDPTIWGLVVHIRELQARELRRQSGRPTPTSGVYKSAKHSFRLETVVSPDKGLVTPWGLSWLPDRRMLVTNRGGTMHLVEKDGTLKAITGLPANVEFGQGGLMDVAVHPDYSKNGWVYIAHNDPAPSGRGGLTRISRGKLSFGGDAIRWTNNETIYAANEKHYTRAGVHFGARIVFRGGYVYFAIGERGSNMGAQSLETPFGKIMRLHDDGKVPSDNPFVKTAGADPAVWTYGHRNQQGLVFGLDGRLWTTEHAPRGGDELNEVIKGANYGWPVVSFGINYNDSAFRTPWPEPDQKITMPIFRWLPSTGVCGLAVGDGKAFPEWKGDLLASGLAGSHLDRIRVKDGKLVEREELLQGIGRVRDTKVGPDGFIYLAINGPNQIIRLVPAN